MSNSLLTEKQPYLPWAVSSNPMLYSHAVPCTSQDQTSSATPRQEIPELCIYNNSVWQQLLGQLLLSNCSRRRTNCTKYLLGSPRRMHLHRTHKQTVSQESLWVNQEGAAPCFIPFNSLCLFSEAFTDVNHELPALNPPLFDKLDSALGHHAWEVRGLPNVWV